MKTTQLEFPWSNPASLPAQLNDSRTSENADAFSSSPGETPQVTTALDEPHNQPALSDLSVPPAPTPLPGAVEAGVFGVTEEGPINPDAEDVYAITEEHAHEMMATLADLQAAEHGLRSGHDPRTGRIPKTPEACAKLAEFLTREAQRLKTAYGDALAAYAQGFGDEATQALDSWARLHIAGSPSSVGRYDPGHPWHYLPEGDDAPPIPVDAIESSPDAARHMEHDLPKNPTKRYARMREMLEQERASVEEDRRRYQEIVERGAEALSRYDREIAHTSDAMARATALALKFNHIRFGLGRVMWLEVQLRHTTK